MSFQFYVERSRATGSAKLAITIKEPGSARSFVQPFTMKSFEPGMAVPDDQAFVLVDSFIGGSELVVDFLQAAADAAWEQGIRPSQVKDMSGELAAVRYHLEDMRRLVVPAAGASK